MAEKTERFGRVVGDLAGHVLSFGPVSRNERNRVQLDIRNCDSFGPVAAWLGQRVEVLIFPVGSSEAAWQHVREQDLLVRAERAEAELRELREKLDAVEKALGHDDL